MGSLDAEDVDNSSAEAGSEPTLSLDRLHRRGVATPVRVAVVDDHAIVLRGVRATAEAHPDVVRVVWTASTAAELFDRVVAEAPDLVLLDLWLRDFSDPGATVHRLTESRVPCLIHTSELRPVPLRQVLVAGARGVALKADPEDSLLEALVDVMAGEIAMSSDMAFLLATDDHLAAHLAPRELQALQLLGSGVPRKTIGHRMQPPVGEATVTTYLSRAAGRYSQLGRPVGNAFDVVREAHRDGYLDL